MTSYGDDPVENLRYWAASEPSDMRGVKGWASEVVAELDTLRASGSGPADPPPRVTLDVGTWITVDGQVTGWQAIRATDDAWSEDRLRTFLPSLAALNAASRASGTPAEPPGPTLDDLKRAVNGLAERRVRWSNVASDGGRYALNGQVGIWSEDDSSCDFAYPDELSLAGDPVPPTPAEPPTAAALRSALDKYEQATTTAGQRVAAADLHAALRAALGPT